MRSLYVVLLLMLLILPLCANAEAADDLLPSDIPGMTETGFLAPGSEPYILEDEERGVWGYADDELRIIIHRRQNPPEEEKLVWYETDVLCSPGAPLASLLTVREDGKMRGHIFRSAMDIAMENRAVLAINDDYFSYRWYNEKKQGVIIRNGQVMAEEPAINDSTLFPPLEILAMDKSGALHTFKGSEHTAQEYIDMGFTDTWAFGPILVQDGRLGDRMDSKELSSGFDPRTAIGMIEPCHYMLLTVEGRVGRSSGCSIRWLADKMMELGAVEAINLDGGGTTTLIFMGKQLNQRSTSLRNMGSMIGFGVGKYDPEKSEK